ncbi:MAG TPA: hypothetical protein VJU14_04625 [Solirubrobacterales bacterium]|nr:hypothetical protein [Solirubrobacterales bacterium]
MSPMRRPSLLAPVLAIVALLVGAPSAPAAVAPQDRPASIQFELAANNGLDAHLETFDGKVVLEIERRNRIVSYEVEGEATEAGLKARFGKLGLIDVAFEPGTTRTFKPPKGCKGEPSTFSEGLYVGTIQFTGERNYVRIEATRAKGTMSVSRPQECPKDRRSGRLQPLPRSSPFSSLQSARGEEASLFVNSRTCRCFFAAYARPEDENRGSTLFLGAKLETREGMEIGRATAVEAGPSTFTFNHKAGTASVDPPQPFTGTATFKRRKGRDLWRSTLRVPLLGADPMSLRGRGFRAHLARNLPSD